MANRHGTPIWYELITPDPDAATRFYGHVLGWSVEPAHGGLGRDYRIAEANGTGVAGLMRRENPAEGGWLVYFGVDDVDRSTAEAQEAGATVHVPPADIPGVGRFSLLADPLGSMFYLMRGASEENSRAFVCGERAPEGHAVWNELSSPDPVAALRFYGSLLGLRHEGGMPMGALGEYRFLHCGPDCIGALMPAMPNGASGWLVYFAVDDIDRAASRLGEAGGRTVQGPDEIPGGAFSLVAKDGEGAHFGLVGPRAG